MQMTKDKNYAVGSLFAGVGGVCRGFEQAKFEGTGYDLVWANEVDEHAAETYRTNFKHDLIVGDIEKVLDPTLCDKEKDEYIKQLKIEKDEKKRLELNQKVELCEKEKIDYEDKKVKILKRKIDVLMGGFPCQAFSIAGSMHGFDDHRGNLFWNIIKLVELLEPIHGKPRVLFLENVKNLMSHDGGNTYKVIKEELIKIGYFIQEAVLNTMNYSDLPQNRERIYIVGFLHEDDESRFTLFKNLDNFLKIKGPEDRIEDIKGILDLDIDKEGNPEYYYTKDRYPNYFITEEEYLKIPEEQRKDVRINLDEQITEEYQFYQVRRGMYVRQNKSDVCPTLTANMGTGGHNVPIIKVKDGIRKLTPTETFKLQGFPVGNGYTLPTEYKGKKYPNSSLYKQAGNAVSVPVIKLIAEEILKALK
jgi:DNA (cytosine-5)-methyltransferase 1